MSAKKSKPKKRPARNTRDAQTAEARANEAMTRLVWALPQLEPPKAVKARLLARMTGGRTVDAPMPGWRFAALTTNEDWVALPFPGVRMREVTVDQERDTALVYVEMAPRAAFPDHVHRGRELGLLITGDLEMDGRRLGAGDFYEADAGTRHERIASPSGCTGLLWVSATAWRAWRAAIAEGGKR